MPEHRSSSVLPRGTGSAPWTGLQEEMQKCFLPECRAPSFLQIFPFPQYSEAKPTQPCCCFQNMHPVPHSPPRESSNPPWKTAPAEPCLSQIRLVLAFLFAPGEGPVCFPHFRGSKAESEGQKLQDSTCTLVVEGSCWAQSTAKASPQLPQDPIPGPFPLLPPHQAVGSSRDQWGSRGLSPALVPPRGAQ